VLLLIKLDIDEDRMSASNLNYSSFFSIMHSEKCRLLASDAALGRSCFSRDLIRRQEIVDLQPPRVVTMQVHTPSPTHTKKLDEFISTSIQVLSWREYMRAEEKVSDETTPSILRHHREQVEEHRDWLAQEIQTTTSSMCVIAKASTVAPPWIVWKCASPIHGIHGPCSANMASTHG
jgi:hypothetical protein